MFNLIGAIVYVFGENLWAMRLPCAAFGVATRMSPFAWIVSVTPLDPFARLHRFGDVRDDGEVAAEGAFLQIRQRGHPGVAEAPVGKRKADLCLQHLARGDLGVDLRLEDVCAPVRGIRLPTSGW